MENIDCLVVGAGVVGLAIARALALQGREVIVLEAEDAIGKVTSSRNSEVIHAGIYYPKGSLMARFCVEGKKALYDYCAAHHVAHQRCGKLLVATNEAEVTQLDGIAAHAAANGVDDLVRLSAKEAGAMEPALAAKAALLSPSTGIIDSHGLMLALQGEAEAGGTFFAFNTPFLSGRITEEGIIVEAGGEEPMTLLCRTFINAAGHGAPGVAARLEGFPRNHVPKAYFAKGNYFSLSGKAPFSRLIYPVPSPGGLGVHLTLDLGGQARFGPDVEWVEGLDYEVDPQRGESFYAAIRRYWPDLPDNSLIAAYSGIRPKIVPPAIAKQDFVISGPADHGLAGVIQLFGIESPGLTSCLALGAHVAHLSKG